MTLPLTTLTTLNRQQLGDVFKDPRTLLAFERIQRQVAEIIPETFAAFQNLDFVVTSGDTQIPNAHVITEGANIDVAVAAGLVTITATPSGASGQIQYNDGGVFGGFTVGGDATLNTTTGVLTIANSAVTYAKMQNTSAASVLLGRGAASGAGVVQEITLGSGVSMAGTVLSATGSGGTVTSIASADGSITVTNPTTTADLAVVKSPKLTTARTIAMSGDVVWSTSFDGSANVTAAGTIQSNAVTTSKINNAAVTYAKIQNVSANSVLLGSSATGSGSPPSEITLGSNLSMSGSTLNASGGSGTVTTTGSPASGNLTKFSGASSITNGDLSGDVTTSGTLVTTIGALKVATGMLQANAVTLAKVAQGTALSVLGVASNATANYADIVAASDKQVLRRSGTTVGFGAIDLSSSSAVTGNLSTTNLNSGTGATSTSFWRGDGTWATPATGGGTGPRQGNITLPVASSFAWVNQGDASMTDGTAALIFTALPNASNNLRIIKKSGSSVYACIEGTAALTNSIGRGLVVRNSTSGKVIVAYYQAQAGELRLVVERWNSATSFNASIYAGNNQWSALPWMSIANDGTTLSFQISPNGLDWFTAATEPLATFISSVDEVGFVARVDNASGTYFIQSLSTAAPT